jgi:hypothetical protein
MPHPSQTETDGIIAAGVNQVEPTEPKLPSEAIELYNDFISTRFAPICSKWLATMKAPSSTSELRPDDKYPGTELPDDPSGLAGGEKTELERSHRPADSPTPSQTECSERPSQAARRRQFGVKLSLIDTGKRASRHYSPGLSANLPLQD